MPAPAPTTEAELGLTPRRAALRPLEQVRCVVDGFLDLGKGTAGTDRSVSDALYEEGARTSLESGEPPSDFMNFGFAPAHPRAAELLKDFVGPDAASPEAVHSFTTYLRLFEQASGRGTIPENGTVLEVGCGKGAGLALLGRIHPQFRFVGLDLSRANIQCASFAQSPRGNCTWMVGSALDLPFADNSVDAIINCESSHCYPDFARFVAEAERVLKPGGYFAIADLRWVDKCWSYRTFNPEAPLLHQMKAALNASGLHTVAEWDITPNVVASRELCTASEAEKLRQQTPRTRFFNMNHRALVGTHCFRLLQGGHMSYFNALMTKPHAKSPRERLTALAELHAAGLISQSVYEREQAAIVCLV